ncbi:hypothetical protein KIW84_063892 [Lathyrus oleraceus]|uniref:Uncharacterized protein n=1 Tax=Pisum sativum TaxID=3888 RepID=A0A9D5A7W8_PEA|nr:hypothetical protein KIW84_063892 [Pisum sativum]
MMERKGSALVNMSSEMWQFSEFIEDSNLVDLPYKDEWKSITVVWRSHFVIKEKFKILKGRLKKWNYEVFGKVLLEVNDNTDKINSIDALLGCCKEEQVEGLMASRSKVTSDLWRKEVKEEVRRHLSAKFKEPEANKPTLDNIGFNTLSSSEKAFLEA